MKLVNKFIRFTQLIAALVLISGYFLHEPAIQLMKTVDLVDIPRDVLITVYYYTIAYIVGMVPVRYVIEKIVESKFML
jgi:DNA integrity scanning protein DisA with diadenylate cyclase activity